jgi:hypothetical protein
MGGGDSLNMAALLRFLPRRLDLAGAGLGTVLAGFLVMCLASLAVVTFFVVRIPADYFSNERQPPASSVWARVAIAVLKNVAGVALVLVGIVLSLPGIPGQGILTILVGLMLTDLPGVRRLERALVRRRGVKRALDAIRAKFGKDPLKLD